MAPVRDLLALILGIVLGIVWTAHMVALIVRQQVPAETDWLILPTGTAALLTAIYVPAGRAYQPRHLRQE